MTSGNDQAKLRRTRARQLRPGLLAEPLRRSHGKFQCAARTEGASSPFQPPPRLRLLAFLAAKDVASLRGRALKTSFGIHGVQSKLSWLSWPHPRIAPAVPAVDRALAWYIGEVPLANQPPVSLAQAEHLREVLAATRPRANAHFEIVVAFARTRYRFGQH